MFTANKLLSDVRAWWHQYPALVTTDARVPGRCAEWVLMHLTTRASWANQEPSMRRCFLLSHLVSEKLSRSAFDEIVTYEFNKEVLAQDFGRLIFIDDLLDLWMVLNVALKEVQWRIVSIVNCVLDVLSQRQFKPFALLGLSNLEPGVREPFNEPLQSDRIRMLTNLKILLTFSCHL